MFLLYDWVPLSIQYIELILLDERESLNVRDIYTFLCCFFPRVSIMHFHFSIRNRLLHPVTCFRLSWLIDQRKWILVNEQHLFVLCSVIFTCNLYELFIVYLTNHMALLTCIPMCFVTLFFLHGQAQCLEVSFQIPSHPTLHFVLFYFSGHRTCETLIKCHVVK